MTPVDRFWRFVRKGEGCWLWTGSQTGRRPFSHGQFHYEGRMVLAHRFSYELANGPVPQGLLVLHRCDVRPCVRPDHLYVGTFSDNARDAALRTQPFKVTPEVVARIRQLQSEGWSQRRIGAAVGITQPQVSRVLSGQRWGWRRYVEPTVWGDGA